MQLKINAQRIATTVVAVAVLTACTSSGSTGNNALGALTFSNSSAPTATNTAPTQSTVSTSHSSTPPKKTQAPPRTTSPVPRTTAPTTRHTTTPPKPKPTAPPNLCGAPANPYGYNFCSGPLIYSPAAGVCS